MQVELVAGDFVQRAEGFVHQQQSGAQAQGAGDGDALLHAAGELPGVAGGEVGEADGGEGGGGAGFPLGGGEADDFEREHDVGRGRCARDKRGRLEDIAVGTVLRAWVGVPR